MSSAAIQADLISDDPRREAEKGVFAEFAEFYQASKELHGLLTQSQAKRMLGVSSGHLGTWISRGRISSRVISGVRMVSAGEVLALVKERQTEKSEGGRGHKAPSLANMVEDAYNDLLKD